jgi:hypothetical protein
VKQQQGSSRFAQGCPSAQKNVTGGRVFLLARVPLLKL